MKRCVILWSIFVLTDQQQYYDAWWHSNTMYQRLLINMRTYSEDANVRYAEMTKIRPLYERSAQFEMGYIMSEILERYRKMVHAIKFPREVRSRSDSLFINIKRLEFMQKLFLEIYHLVNMMHEINRKYYTMLKIERDARGNVGADTKAVNEALQRIKLNNMLKEKQRKRRQKILQRQRKYKYIVIDLTKSDHKGSKWWPIDYGWEIDYYW